MLGKETVLKQVQAAFAYEAGINLQNHAIAMHFVDGMLVLDGEVPDIACKKRSLALARTICNGNGLLDHLRVAAGEQVGDGALRDAVCARILQHLDFHNCSVRSWVKEHVETQREVAHDPSGSLLISVEDGAVTLSGHVISLTHKRLAGVLAWWSPGCRDVINELAVLPLELDNDYELIDALRLVLESDPFIHADQIGITCENRVVSLHGIVSSSTECKRAEQDAWYLFGLDGVNNQLQVRK